MNESTVSPAISHDAEPALPAPVPGVKEIMLVASGKGGVGKSSVAVNFAVSFAANGLNVGLLDADLYGPSVARMMGSGDNLAINDEGLTIPALNHDVYSVSVGNLLPPEAPMVWKGGLIAQAVVQMFREVAWPDLDLLIVDMPPGTGDVHLTILEQIPIVGAVIVTTPQKLAVADAERGIAMFHELDIPVFGLIENMKGYTCPCCGEEQEIFPSGAVKTLARRRHVANLGSIPLDMVAQEAADGGTPLVIANPNGPAAAAFGSLVEKVGAALDRERKSAIKRAGQGE